MGEASYSGDGGGSLGTKILVKEQTFGASNVKVAIGHHLGPVQPNSHHNLIPYDLHDLVCFPSILSFPNGYLPSCFRVKMFGELLLPPFELHAQSY